MSYEEFVGPRRLTVASFVLGPLALVPRHPLAGLGLLLLAAGLTVVTQTAGIALWLATPLLAGLRDRLARGGAPFAGTMFALAGFVVTFLVNALVVTPGLAALVERVPLPCVGDSPLQPVTKWTCLFSRHYVTPALKTKLEALASDMAQRSPGDSVYYLDAGFPFGFGLPMLPHVTHLDGRAVDLAFAYQAESPTSPTGFVPSEPPSPLGYGKFEPPGDEEARPCADVDSPLRWSFAWLQPLMSEAAMDRERTHAIIAWLLTDTNRPAVRRIFLEPHLRDRLALTDARVRFEGCDDTRHDDHLHVEL